MIHPLLYLYGMFCFINVPVEYRIYFHSKLFDILTFLLLYIRSHILYGPRGTVAYPPLTGRNALDAAEEPTHFSRSIKAHAK